MFGVFTIRQLLCLAPLTAFANFASRSFSAARPLAVLQQSLEQVVERLSQEDNPRHVLVGVLFGEHSTYVTAQRPEIRATGMRWSVRFVTGAVDKSIQITGEMTTSLIGGLRDTMITALEHISDVQCGIRIIEIDAADRFGKRRLPVLLKFLI
ncbi:carboxymethylenebutenolidase, putative [Babesia ovata]|uniref:Carboxymethylenebutenolidase, putative n=1 Tax=Babesia ovata TaxID=189622 RepID=A0A2H6KK04_9APIC|nr:carboxymethylenebutenolidase, putative [Babesia ovata]GBE63310.1 carboxymethylenebutenolidase, putative [Babesia ovata]